MCASCAFCPLRVVWLITRVKWHPERKKKSFACLCLMKQNLLLQCRYSFDKVQEALLEWTINSRLVRAYFNNGRLLKAEVSADRLWVQKKNPVSFFESAHIYLRYGLQILQQLKPTDKVRRYELLLKFPGKVGDDYKITSKLVVRDEAMYHLSERVNRRSLRVLGTENSRGKFSNGKGKSKYQCHCISDTRIPLRAIFFLVESAMAGIV